MMKNKTASARPDYGNWVSKRLIYPAFVVGLIVLGLSFLYSILAARTRS
jgi:hypothetical protein